MVKKFTIPFASQGDANDIPDALQVDGKVSFTQGFGYDYERPYDDPQAKDIAREDMNGLFKAITSAVGELQTLGASEWSDAIAYPKGAIVYYEKDLYISQIDDNQNKPPQSWTSIKNIADDSLKKAANLSDLTNKATARNNLGLGSSATLNKTDVPGTSTSLVATQKLVNDTKINLESSKQDKLSFVGGGPEVMKRGAYGLGAYAGDLLEDLESPRVAGFYRADSSTASNPLNNRHGINIVLGTASSQVIQLLAGSNSEPRLLVKFRRDESSTYPWYEIAHSGNLQTTTGQSNTHAMTQKATTDALATKITGGSVVQTTGSSTTNVMSQKAVTDRLNSIENSHGLGYGQNWVDVTKERSSNTIYQNTTGKPISIYIDASPIEGKHMEVSISPGGPWVRVGKTSSNAGIPNSFIVPVGAYYRTSHFAIWTELR